MYLALNDYNVVVKQDVLYGSKPLLLAGWKVKVEMNKGRKKNLTVKETFYGDYGITFNVWDG